MAYAVKMCHWEDEETVPPRPLEDDQPLLSDIIKRRDKQLAELYEPPVDGDRQVCATDPTLVFTLRADSQSNGENRLLASGDNSQRCGK